MGQIVSSAAKPKRCNANQLSQVPTPAAGEHILVSSDNSMNADGQGNFDCYIVGDGTTAATALELKKINPTDSTPTADSELPISSGGLYELLYGKNSVDNIVIERGGSVNFDAITLSQAGDFIEIVLKPKYGEANSAYSYAAVGNSNISNGLQLGVGVDGCELKDANNVWIVNPNNSEGRYTRTSDILTARIELFQSSSVLTIKNAGGTTIFTKTHNALTSFRFDCFANLKFSTYYWSGTIYSLKAKSGANEYTLNNINLVNAEPTKTTINRTQLAGKFDEIDEQIEDVANDVETNTQAINDLNVAINSMGNINDVADVVFNSFGTITLPNDSEKTFRVKSINGIVYNSKTMNMADLLMPKSGTLTVNGVTITIDGNKVSVSGTATAGCFVSFSDLQSYVSADAAAAAITFPSLPAINIALSLIDSVTGTYNCYFRYNDNTWGPLLTSNANIGNVNASDVSKLAAFGMYVISGTTYSGEFYLGLFKQEDSRRNKTNLINAVASTEIITKTGVYNGFRTWLYEGTANIEEIAAATNQATTNGKKIAWFGDSLSELKNLPHLVEERVAQKVYDCSQAGAPLTYSSEDYQDTGFMSLCSQIAAQDFSPLITAINKQYTDGLINATRRDAKLANANTLAAIDFSSLDKIVVFAGTNDLSVAALTIQNLKSGLTSALQTLFGAYPNLNLYGVLPVYRSDALVVHPNGLTLPQINEAIAEVYDEFNIPYIDFYHKSGINANNYTYWLSDGLHQTDAGDLMMADKLSQWLLS